MDRILIQGGTPLTGEIEISGAKNAALPLMAASLLTDEPLVLENVPRLADVATMGQLLRQFGVALEPDGDERRLGQTMTLQAAKLESTLAHYDLVRKMRASVLVLGPLVARCGHGEVSLPGGCAIGTRPIDIHLSGLEAMGAKITLEEGYVRAAAPDGLKGGTIALRTASVGATENLMMAAALASGTTHIVNAAREPEIVDLAECLVAMGARIEGAGTVEIVIHGQPRLHGARHSVVPDRIEAGTFAMAAAITDGSLHLIGARAAHLLEPLAALRSAGVRVEETARGLKVERLNGRLQGTDVMTAAFPGFATDLQAQFMALMTTAQGAAMITETIFENRFMHVPELARMGADITVHGASALVRGKERLKGAPVMATDLRASVSMVLAGLCAQGETVLNRIYHLDRGYERLVEKLARCGASIQRLPG